MRNFVDKEGCFMIYENKCPGKSENLKPQGSLRALLLLLCSSFFFPEAVSKNYS